MSNSGIQPFTKNFPCPVCGGWNSQPRGKAVRCYGFLSSDGMYAHCSREERAGSLRPEANGTYAHWLGDDCRCGQRHESSSHAPQAESSKSKRRILATYDYRDHDGKLLYQVVRYDPKDFRQRHPDGQGGWKWGRNGIAPILYRLPELLAADPAAPVYITEGEKDADALVALGCVATTSVDGAGKWRDEYNEALHGRHVTILPDNDEKGHDHAEQVAQSLRGDAASVRVLPLPNLPEKGDVYDWLAAGGTAEGLHNLAETTPVREARFGAKRAEPVESGEREAGRIIPLASERWPDDLVRAWECDEPAPRKFLMGKMVPDGCITQFYGDGGQGKSYIALAMAIHVTLGRSFLGMATERRPALYLDAELDAEEFLRRAYQVARGLGMERPPQGLHYHRLDGSLADRTIQRAVQDRIDTCLAGFVVLDSLTIGSFGADMKEADAVTGVMKAMEAWGVPILAIDHIAKPAFGANQSNYRAFGSVFKGNVARSAIQIVKAEVGGLSLIHKKTNFGPPANPVHLALEFGDDAIAIRALEGDDERLMGAEDNLPATERVFIALAKYERTTPAQLSDDLGLSEKTIRNHLTILKREGRAEQVGGGEWRVTQPAKGPRALPRPDEGRADNPPDGDEDLVQLAF